MRILALEPYFGGSHRAFLEGWSAISHHGWTTLTLPPFKWKWRMRHAPVTLAEEVNRLLAAGETWDIIWCSDMLSLAEFRGLVGRRVSALPAIAYFHENQLTYPVRRQEERDVHFALTNFTTALAATEVWFNSAFHRDSFLGALTGCLKQMPDHQLTDRIDGIRAKSRIQPQGIREMPQRDPGRAAGPPRLLWAARWEHDKNPEMFFGALRILMNRGVGFQVSVVGEQFSSVPEVFAEARAWLGERVRCWGYQESRVDYERALLEADVVVSTAAHEFFGVSVVEAIAAGAYPLLPRRLAYPEILSPDRVENSDDFFYDGSLEDLVRKLTHLLSLADSGQLWGDDPQRGLKAVSPYCWKNLGPRLDDALERVRLSSAGT